MTPVGSDGTLFSLDCDEPEPPMVALVSGSEGAVQGLRLDRLVEMKKVGAPDL